jgi:CRISPR-associated protein Csc3
MEKRINQMKLPLSGDELEDGMQDPPDMEAFDRDADEVPETTPSTLAAVALSDEPLFSHLLRRAIVSIWPDDVVMRDFVEMVVPSLSKLLAHVSAKGADFVQDQLDAGMDAAKVARYLHDQSMRAHLINGLLPALHVAEILNRWEAPQFSWYDDTVRRVAMAGYVLHDWLKLPDVDVQLARVGLSHDQVNATQHRAVVEQLFVEWGTKLGLDSFLAPVGGLEELLHDLIYVACNTQIKWGTLRNLTALPTLRLPGRQRDLAEKLSRLADYLAYVGRDPREEDAYKSIRREIANLSDQRAQVVYHHLADVRGVLTNLIHNSVLEAMRSDDCIPLLYAPSAVVYLVRRKTLAFPAVEDVAEGVIQEIGKQTRQLLLNKFTGFQRGNVGLKYANYYTLFFSNLELIAVGLEAASKIIHSGKQAVSVKRFEKMASSEWIEPDRVMDLPSDTRVDLLAEWCFFVEKLTSGMAHGKQVPQILLTALGLQDIQSDFVAIPRDSRAGGVGYHWYFAAGHYLQRNPGLDPKDWHQRIIEIARSLREQLVQLNPDITQLSPAPEFDDLRAYVAQILSFGPTKLAASETPQQHFAMELNRYSNAKRRGKATGAMCALCSSSFGIKEQREAAILFAPQVYSNKLSLHGAKAIRDICSICSLETMLRQLLMNDGNRSGGNFESAKFRYLYLYPTYFFTPETMAVLNEVYHALRHVSFTELRNQLVAEEDGREQVRMDSWTWQRLESLLLAPTPPEHDRMLRLRFAGNTPITFFFMGIPPGRDATDGEAWVQPAFLALLLPLLLDVKVVASESSLPLLNEATELPQTVFLDGPHVAIQHIVGRERINLDQLLPSLNRLAVSYLIHLDGNARRGGAKGFDYAWQSLPPLARRLNESSLYAFWYLKRWQRSSQIDSIPTGKAALYLHFQSILNQGGPDEMSHARTLTELYRRFYRGSRWNSNSILRPIAVASKTLLTADKWLRDDHEALLEVVRGEMHSFVDRVAKRRADGFVPRIEMDGVKQIDTQAIDTFATYFVNDLFLETFKGDLSALRGKQLNLLKSACEVLYRDMDRQSRSAGATLEQDIDFAVAEGDEMEEHQEEVTAGDAAFGN